MPDVIGVQLLFAYNDVITPALVVATRGKVNDWAAYVAGVPAGFGSKTVAPEGELAQTVAEVGYKLTEDQARAFFPTMQGDYRP